MTIYSADNMVAEKRGDMLYIGVGLAPDGPRQEVFLTAKEALRLHQAILSAFHPLVELMPAGTGPQDATGPA